jgi:hypothetical protein
MISTRVLYAVVVAVVVVFFFWNIALFSDRLCEAQKLKLEEQLKKLSFAHASQSDVGKLVQENTELKGVIDNLNNEKGEIMERCEKRIKVIESSCNNQGII